MYFMSMFVLSGGVKREREKENKHGVNSNDVCLFCWKTANSVENVGRLRLF